MKKYEVEFQANWMLCKIENDDDEIRLYAEVNDPELEALDSAEYDEAIYPILKDEIISQAKEEGIDPEQLKFWWDEEEKGTVENFEAYVALMDDEIREQVHAELAPCTEEEFLEKYMELHEEKYGEEFTI